MMSSAALEGSNGESQAIDSPLVASVSGLHTRYQSLRDGSVSDCLPELAQANPDWFGICAVTLNGHVYEAGDSLQPFTMQSISKPFVFGLALEDRGPAYVGQRVGVEPTGAPFNAIVQREHVLKRQFNPMINAGAIATSGMIKGSSLGERWNRLRHMCQRYIGRPVFPDESVLQSRRNTDSINRAMAYLMLSEGLIDDNLDEIIELYTRQCSILVNCQDLAIMAATLANGGINPITRERAISASYVKNILSVMYTCGMYDFSGQWAYRVGLPAKSGLSGAIIAVVPGRMGIAVFSPPLGDHNKSVRGVKVCEELSMLFGLHAFKSDAGEENTGLGVRNHRQSSYPVRRRKAARRLSVDDASFPALLQDLHRQFQPMQEGECYCSEPGLTEINANWFAICAVTIDGQVFEVGDSRVPYLIQSISKVFAYGLALEDHGREYVLTKVDVEPTGNRFDAIIKLEENSKRPHNPMVNAGGIATTSLIKGAGRASRLTRLLEMYRRYIGHEVFVDMRAYLSEQASGDRNRAISYLLRNFGMIEGEINETLDLYLQQCSAIINCRDLATMGATLANHGVNPMTGQRAIDARYVSDLLSVMYTCGMYDFAGEWGYKVGLPAKSGVSGGIVAVVPSRMGIAVFSPPLDDHGNSVRGIEVFKALSRHIGLHIFDVVPDHAPYNWLRQHRRWARR